MRNLAFAFYAFSEDVCIQCIVVECSFFSLLTKKFLEVVEQKSLDFLLVGVSLILFLIEYGIYSRHDCHC